MTIYENSTIAHYKQEVPVEHSHALETIGFLACIVLVFGLIIFVGNVCEAIFDTRKKVNTLLSRRKK